ncbi:hypothetical protein F5Y15DRAFT_414427 [Xylariaceae sp. FL0016]|nr:hypothetical protein F5Y15DRAFT_414427 [Xylariaceae sp. FL0016]
MSYSSTALRAMRNAIQEHFNIPLRDVIPVQDIDNIWPPPDYQAYCLEHFLVECALYHRFESAKYEALENQLIGCANKAEPPQRPPKIPARVQPPRLAKTRSNTMQVMKTKLGSRKLKSGRIFDAAEKPELMLHVLRDIRIELELHKPWQEFKKSLEQVTTQVGARLNIKSTCQEVEDDGYTMDARFPKRYLFVAAIVNATPGEAPP